MNEEWIQFNSFIFSIYPTRFPTAMWLVAAFGAFIVIVSAVVAVIFRRRIRAANATNNPVRLHVSDELEGEFLLQSDDDISV